MSDSTEPRPIRKRIRLPHECYAEPLQVISITIATLHRRRIFEHDSITAEFVDSLKNASQAHGITVMVYCFMPDHVHLLLQLGQSTSPIRFINAYKSWTTRVSWRFGYKGQIWQRSFYDHILRRKEDILRHMRYLVDNPVRAGLVEYWWEYPHTGSFLYELTDIDW